MLVEIYSRRMKRRQLDLYSFTVRLLCLALVYTYKKIVLTFSLAHVAIAHFPVAGGTLTVVAALGVLTDLRTGVVHLTLIDVWKSEMRL